MTTPTPVSCSTETAQLLLSCLDLTSLNDSDDEYSIEALCKKADTPKGAVAAVCVWPRLAKFTRKILPAHIAVAAVANFPSGNKDPQSVLYEIFATADAGVQEIDVVLPYSALLGGDSNAVRSFLMAVRKASDDLVLKVILETGALQTAERIALASELCLDAGVDFLKTSTGKIPAGATLAAAEVMLNAIAQRPDSIGRAGFKASGGVRTLPQALQYLALAQDHFGVELVDASTFRIGASALLDEVLAAA